MVSILNFYDYEVFKYDWMVVIINPINKEKTVIVNDRERLTQYYEDHKSEIWIGYNSTHYDQYIQKSILCGFDPKKVNDFIIVDKEPGWKWSSLLRKFPMYDFDIGSKFHSLKQLEGFMGDNIKETSVPFDINRKLTPAEIAETIKYCTHDVEETIEVFLNRKDMFDAHIALIKAFNLPLSSISKTQAQLVAMILGAHRRDYDDEFDIKIPKTLRLKKYKFVLDWYLDPKNRDYEKKLDVEIAGVPHTFAWGGVHGALPKYSGEGWYLNMDVSSLYPSLMIVYNYFSRSIRDPQRYVDIYHTNLRMKKEKNPLRPAYKLVCNTTYGCMKDKRNPLYDPQMANNICIAGQLLLLDLIEKLEPHCEIIQSNTDGVLVKLRHYDDYDLIDDIVFEWELRTGLSMEFDEYRKIYQKDVNNYIVIDADGHHKSKGAYLKKLNAIDYDLPIINKALLAYFKDGVPVEKTIGDCDDMIEFQKVVRISAKYMYGIKNATFRTVIKDEWYQKVRVNVWNGDGEILNDRTFRVFASKRESDGAIYKLKSLDKNPEKFANTPDHCFIDNGSIKGKRVPRRLDKQWYIDLAKKRLEQFGV